MIKKKGFFLFEAILTIAVLSLGIVFIIRSLSTTIKATRTSLNYSRAMNLASEKLMDLQLQAEENNLALLSAHGHFLSEENFKWKYTLTQLPEENLAKLILDISWKEGKIDRNFSIVTYLRKNNQN